MLLACGNVVCDGTGILLETKPDKFDKIFSSGADVFDTHTCRGFSTRQGIFDGSVAPDTISKALMNFK